MAVASMTHAEGVQDFLAQKRIAVSGLSRTKDSGAGAIYLKLRASGYDVFAVHPSAESLLGELFDLIRLARQKEMDGAQD